ncbi:MAG TPA: crotonase/enoyl-CoA hydratase family protein [Nitriliruptoraceae bacterium]|nr:crotonase/enoyl-CoA hydratase family protein [Nitriliruptoraceae bacterium]
MAVTTQIDDGIAVVTMDDGGANALGPERFDELHAAFDDAGDDVTAFLVTGRPGMTTAGLDLKFMQTAGAEAVAALLVRFGTTMMRIWTEPRPTVLAATGHTLAAGTMLAMACDHTVAARGQFWWGLTETQINFTIPEFGIALARANMRADLLDDLLLPGAKVGPARAVEAGFADELAEPDEVLDRARAHAQSLAALPSQAYADTKRRLRGATADHVRATLAADIASMDHFLGN